MYIVEIVTSVFAQFLVPREKKLYNSPHLPWPSPPPHKKEPLPATKAHLWNVRSNKTQKGNSWENQFSFAAFLIVVFSSTPFWIPAITK